jgi:predicted enzyme related to lactoylglutathione lyase
MAIVNGIGGVFIKSPDPKYIARWYEDNLGIGFGTTSYFSFKWRDTQDQNNICHTVFSFFRDDTTYFYPGTNDIMLNFRVQNLDDLRIRLKNDGVQVIDKIESYEYGRFGWVMDPAGNKIELWEPLDEGFGDRNKPMELFEKVTGFGGVFLKMPDHSRMSNWYSKHFGLFDSGNDTHKFATVDLETGRKNHTIFSLFPETTAYYEPSDKSYMLNFRVRKIDSLIEELKSSGIRIIGSTENYDYGKFAWLLDPDGNKIELWEDTLTE